jgi:hypothetical protein
MLSGESMTPPLRTLIWRVPLLLAGILGTGMFLGLEKYVIFIPDRTIEMTPQTEGLAYEDIWFPAGDGVKLHGWWSQGRTPGSPSCGSMGTRATSATGWTTSSGCIATWTGSFPNIFIFDYRGYGRSAGSLSDLSEEATYHDADGALAYSAGAGISPTRG